MLALSEVDKVYGKGPDPALCSALHGELLHWQPGRYSGWKQCHRDQQEPGGFPT